MGMTYSGRRKPGAGEEEGRRPCDAPCGRAAARGLWRGPRALGRLLLSSSPPCMRVPGPTVGPGPYWVTATSLWLELVVRVNSEFRPPESPRSIPRNLRAEGGGSLFKRVGPGPPELWGAQLCTAFPEALLSPPTPIPFLLPGRRLLGRFTHLCCFLRQSSPREAGHREEARQSGQRTQAQRGRHEQFLWKSQFRLGLGARPGAGGLGTFPRASG